MKYYCEYIVFEILYEFIIFSVSYLVYINSIQTNWSESENPIREANRKNMNK